MPVHCPTCQYQPTPNPSLYCPNCGSALSRSEPTIFMTINSYPYTWPVHGGVLFRVHFNPEDQKLEAYFDDGHGNGRLCEQITEALSHLRIEVKQ